MIQITRSGKMQTHSTYRYRQFVRNTTFLEYGYALSLIALAVVLCVPFLSAPVNASTGIWQVCTQDGVQNIRLDANGGDDKPERDGPVRHCPLCYTRQQQAAITVAATSFAPPVFIPVRIERVTGATHGALVRLIRPYRQRAPPFSRV